MTASYFRALQPAACDPSYEHRCRCDRSTIQFDKSVLKATQNINILLVKVVLLLCLDKQQPLKDVCAVYGNVWLDRLIPR